MRVLVLGGAGEVGRHVTRELVRSLGPDDVVVADIDTDRVHRELDDELRAGVRAIELDVRDRRAFERVPRNVELLVNCAPLTWFDTVLAAAVRAGLDYVDLGCHPTDEHREVVAEAGTTAVAGLGLTPGTSNVLCAHAGRQLDAVAEIEISWASMRSIAPSEGALDTVLLAAHEASPRRLVYRNGRYVSCRPLEGSRVVTFPEPFGPQRVFVISSSEVVTLPRNLPGVSHVAVRGTWGDEIMDDLRVLNRYGLLDMEPLAGPETLTAFDATRTRILTKLGGSRSVPYAWGYYLVVEVTGSRGKDTVRRRYQVWHDDWATESTGRMAGVNASVGVLLFERSRQRNGPGLFDPETFFEPDEYLALLTSREGIHLDSSDEIVPVESAEHFV